LRLYALSNAYIMRYSAIVKLQGSRILKLVLARAS